MKFLAKINRGLILTAVVIIGLAIYLISLNISQINATPEIKSICLDYIKTATSYTMLPEQYRKEKPDITSSGLSSYIDKMTTDIKAFYPDNEQTYKYQLKAFQTSFELQVKGQSVVFSYKKDFSKFSEIVFDGDTAKVSIITNSSIDSVSAVTGQRGTVSGQTNDTITLQKISGKWKIIYADLPQPNQQGQPGSFKSGVAYS